MMSLGMVLSLKTSAHFATTPPGSSECFELLDESVGGFVVEIEQWWSGSEIAEALVPKDRLDRRTEAVLLEEISDNIEVGLSFGILLGCRYERRNHAGRGGDAATSPGSSRRR